MVDSSTDLPPVSFVIQPMWPGGFSSLSLVSAIITVVFPWGVTLRVKWQPVKCEKNVGGNSGNSRHQVQTYEMLEGTLASAYVLHPFQVLVPRFWRNGGGRIRGRIGGRIGVVLRVGLREQRLRGELI